MLPLTTVLSISLLYTNVLRRKKVKTEEIKVWNDETVSQLQDCFDCTDWTVFMDSASSIDELAGSVCCYISFCEDSVIPKKACKSVCK